MRVAYVVSQYPARSHTFIRREIVELRRRGLDVATVSIRATPDEELKDDQDRRDAAETVAVLPASASVLVKALFLGFFRRPLAFAKTLIKALQHRNPGIRDLMWSIFYFVEAMILAFHVRRIGADHLHVHFANAGGTVTYLAAIFTDLPWSMSIHGTADFEFPAGPLLGEKVEAAQFVRCASHLVRAQALRTVGGDQWDKLYVCRCGLADSVLERHQQPTGELRVFCVGRLSSEKGHLGLISAFSTALKDQPTLRLTMIGDGPERSNIEALCESLGVSDKVTFRGSVPEEMVLEELMAADIFALPSLMEGLPVVLMEAMAIGVPVIAPRVAGIPELIDDGEEGLLYTPGEWEDMARALVTLSDQPSLRTKLALQAREKIESEFIISRSIEPLWHSFYDPTRG